MHRADYLHLQDISLISLNFETSLVNSSFEKKTFNKALKSFNKTWSTCKQAGEEEEEISSHVMQTHHKSSRFRYKSLLQRVSK